MIVNFRKNPTVISPVVFNDQTVECARKQIYLGTVIDEKLTFVRHVEAACKKAHQRLRS